MRLVEKPWGCKLTLENLGDVLEVYKLLGEGDSIRGEVSRSEYPLGGIHRGKYPQRKISTLTIRCERITLRGSPPRVRVKGVVTSEGEDKNKAQSMEIGLENAQISLLRRIRAGERESLLRRVGAVSRVPLISADYMGVSFGWATLEGFLKEGEVENRAFKIGGEGGNTLERYLKALGGFMDRIPPKQAIFLIGARGIKEEIFSRDKSRFVKKDSRYSYEFAPEAFIRENSLEILKTAEMVRNQQLVDEAFRGGHLFGTPTLEKLKEGIYPQRILITDEMVPEIEPRDWREISRKCQVEIIPQGTESGRILKYNGGICGKWK